MSTEWIRKHVKPSLVAKYDREMTKLRGDGTHIGNIVDNITKMNQESEQIESEAERRARDLAEDAEYMRYHEQPKNNK